MKRLRIIFIFFTLLGFSLPLIRFNKNGTVSQKENRTLAARPPLIRDGYFNKKLFSEYDSYFNDRFGGKQRLVKINAFINSKIFNPKVLYNQTVVCGKNGWIFYRLDGNDADFYKKNLWNEAQKEAFKNNILKTAKWCEEQEIPFIFLICPNKHSVYEENYCFKRPEGITRADQMAEILNEANAPYIFPRDFLISKKKDYDFPLYYETDTHWNEMGAYLTSTLLNKEIAEIFPEYNFPKIEYKISVEHSVSYGDLVPMLKSEIGNSTKPHVTPKNSDFSDFYTYIKNSGRNGVQTLGKDKKLPRALIFRDSFFSALEPFTSPNFCEAEYRWKQFGESDKEYVLEYKPDLIIFESVERYSPTIVNVN